MARCGQVRKLIGGQIFFIPFLDELDNFKPNFFLRVQPHPHCAAPHFRTVRKKCGRMVPNFYKNEVKLRNKICDLQIKFSGYLHYKSAPPNANGGASEKAPSIGQTSHSGPIAFHID